MTDLPGHSTSGDKKMSILPAIPVLLLGLVSVWLLWPVVVDPLTRRLGRTRDRDDSDPLAEHLFNRWRDGSQMARAERG